MLETDTHNILELNSLATNNQEFFKCYIKDKDIVFQEKYSLKQSFLDVYKLFRIF